MNSLRIAAAKPLLRMIDRTYLLDASALLALFYNEPGATKVRQVLAGAAISAVNLSEVIAKLYDRGLDASTIALNLADADLRVVPLDESAAIKAGELREATRGLGLSLADRCCLATALISGATALTADRNWNLLADQVSVELIR
jgi:ribonuclease VapC